MTKQELFEINTGLNNRHLYDAYELEYKIDFKKIIINFLYENYYDELFSKYKMKTLTKFISALHLANLQNIVDKSFDKNAKDSEVELIIKYHVNNKIKSSLFYITKFLEYYESYNKYDCLHTFTIDFRYIMDELLSLQEDNLYKLWFNDLTYDKFIDDLKILYKNYSNHYIIDDACFYGKCSISELAKRNRKGNYLY